MIMKMRLPIGDYLKEEFPNSYSIKGFPGLGATLLAISTLKYLNIINFDNVFAKLITFIGLGCLIFFFVVIFIEFLSKTFSPLKKLIKLLLLVPNFILTILHSLVKSIVKASVLEIIAEENQFMGEEVILKKRSDNTDDDYWTELIDFGKVKKLELMIKPSAFSYYWRAGLKFSKSAEFPPNIRYGKDIPLFHLTKDENENVLKFHYYTEEGSRGTGKVNTIMKDYQNDVVFLVFKVKRGIKDLLNVTVYNSSKKLILDETFSLHSHRIAKLFAWGDGRDYELNTTIRK